MPVYVNKRTGRLFVQFDYNRQTFKQTLPEGATRAEAKKCEIKMRADVFLRANDMAPPEVITFEQFVKDVYLPHVKKNTPASFYKADMICVAALPFFRGRDLRSIKAADIEAFKSWRMSLPTQHGTLRKPATIVRELSIISKIFSLAVKNDKCDYNPCSRVEKPIFDNRQYKVLNVEDEARFFAAFDKIQGQWAKDICKVVLHTGLRRNDVLGLMKFHVDLDKGIITLQQGKTKRVVIIKMTPDVYEILSRRMMQKGTLIFPSPKKAGGQATSVRSAIRGACIRAKIEILTIRDLRRTGASRLDDEGHGVSDISGFLGHQDTRTAHRYIKGQKRMDRVAETLQKASNPTPNLPAQKLKAVK